MNEKKNKDNQKKRKKTEMNSHSFPINDRMNE